MEAFSQSEKRTALAFPIVGALLLPMAIGLLGFFGLFDAIFLRPLSCFLFFLMAFLPCIKAVKAFSEHISSSKYFFSTFFREFTLIPGGYVYGSDLKRGAIPWITVGLIATNAFIFLTVPERIMDAWVFVPYGNPSAVHVFLSMFTCAFFHAGAAHLLGNMLFLWVLGSVVEPRVGSLQYLFLYIACILTSQVLEALLLILKAAFVSVNFNPGSFHSLGASGAIAGIMGIFVVRCYFSRLKLAVPFFFFPIVSLSTRVNASVLLGLFFALDFAGSAAQFRMDSHVDYWAHVGGYVGGFVMAYMLKLHRDAAREALRVRADRMRTKPLGKREATRRYMEILQEEPENEKALCYLFELHRHNKEKREHYYARLVEVVAKRDFRHSVTLFEEHFPTLTRELSGPMLLGFGLYCYKVGDLEKALPCLEFASEREGNWQAKAMYTLAMIYEEMGRDGLARKTLEQVAEKFPNSPFQMTALERLHKDSKSRTVENRRREFRLHRAHHIGQRV